MNGALVPWADATVHVMTHALHYGHSHSLRRWTQDRLRQPGPITTALQRAYFSAVRGEDQNHHAWLDFV